ncbi:MAG: alpha-L-arabinofuranosidase [Lachnospiraceae bacterium]|nr:alpha-L-arabinofuranosidase [Lachnospiraceae bacterium]
MRLEIGKEEKAQIQNGMIGLFFEDINYAADGGLYAEMLENRSFAFLKASGDSCDYQTEYDGGYAWEVYPAGAGLKAHCVSGSPHSEENPYYMRLETRAAGEGIQNKAYDGVYLKKDMEYKLTFWARCVRFQGCFDAFVEKDGVRCAQASISAAEGQEETYNHFRRYEAVLRAWQDAEQAAFVLCLSEAGVVEFDFISLFPGDAVAGIFRRDLFDMLKELHPGFLRFPGGCIVEGNTLANRYRFKDSLKPVWARKNNWNRWAVHGNNRENGYESVYSHYNQTLGMGYYEYFLLCELLGARPLPVLNVGFACQYQSDEMVGIESGAFREFVQDALDLIEFANGGADTRWGAVRAQMGHEEPFGLTLLGIGNEQWQTEKADFFERYEIFEKAVHEAAPQIRLIGSAGPDVTSERYTRAWEFYHSHREQENFVYAVDEHYYVKPEWLYEHVDFYDDYPREVKVFSGEYAAHPRSGFNMPEANTLEGALAEAAFLTGVERNADVVWLASYAPLFARLGYAQWSPDMIWFNGASCYGSPSYYVQKMFACNMGDVTLDLHGTDKKARETGLYCSAGLDKKSGEIIVKIVNSAEEERGIELALCGEAAVGCAVRALILTGPKRDACNSMEAPEKIAPYEREYTDLNKIVLPPLSFAVLRAGREK